MLRLTVSLFIVSLYLCSAHQLYDGGYFTIHSLKDRPSRGRSVNIRTERRDGSRAIVELPYNGTIPVDDGSPLFGDVEFDTTDKDGELAIRDTIINQNYNEDIIILYNRSLPGSYIEDVRVFNVGRERGFTTYAGFYPSAGHVEVDIVVAAYNTVRIFIEIYVR